MKDFYEKTEYTFADIDSLIKNEVEESIHLDFKDGKALDKSDAKRKDISKDVASFANSDGGIIVYGIIEENHKASKISFIDGNEYTKEWLEQIINSTIQRRIPELIVYPIRNEGKIEESIYLVKIPKSIDTPHLSKDKRFYKRFNFESVPMEEYEIRQSYGQKLKSKLELQSWFFYKLKSKNDFENKFRCEIQVVNTGDVTESSYKVNVYLNNFNKFLNVTWPQNNNHYDYTRMGDNRIKISANSICPIYPNEMLTVLRFEIEVNEAVLVQAFKDVKIEIKLIYENGENEMISSLEEMLEGLNTNHQNETEN